MDRSNPVGPVFRTGRILVYVVLALLVVAVLYAGAMSVLNWGAIGV